MERKRHKGRVQGARTVQRWSHLPEWLRSPSWFTMLRSISSTGLGTWFRNYVSLSFTPCNCVYTFLHPQQLSMCLRLRRPSAHVGCLFHNFNHSTKIVTSSLKWLLEIQQTTSAYFRSRKVKKYAMGTSKAQTYTNPCQTVKFVDLRSFIHWGSIRTWARPSSREVLREAKTEKL